MASKKQATKAKPLEHRTAALEHGSAAFGARYVRDGFAFTPARDLEFALGYGHYAVFIDGDPADATAESRAAYSTTIGVEPRRATPRGVALRAVRHHAIMNDDASCLEAMRRPGPELGEDEAAAIVKAEFAGLSGGMVLLLVEGLVGPDVPCAAVLDLLDKRGDAILGDDRPVTGTAVYTLGYLLRRLPEASAAAAYAKLEAMYRKLANPTMDPQQRPSPIRMLDVVLHGARGSAESGHRFQGAVSAAFLGHVLDDPAYVERVTLESFRIPVNGEPDPRRAFLGGEAVLRKEVSAWKTYKAPGAHARMIERFGSIRSKEVLPMMLEMSAASKARNEAIAWFREHRTFAAPFLAEHAAGRDASAKLAKDVLAKVGEDAG